MAKHKHRRERSSSDLRRRQGKRPAYDRILIVTEGSKTEPNYLNEIRVERRIPNAHIKIVPARGTQPLKVVEHAEMLFRESREFEHVFAVFDRDSHPIENYRNALTKCAALNERLNNSEGKKVKFDAIASVPCFEFWLLLHFVDEQAYHERHVIYARLRQYWPHYQKGQKGTYAESADKLPYATARAQNLRRHYTANHGSQPFTAMDVLINKLRSTGGA